MIEKKTDDLRQVLHEEREWDGGEANSAPIRFRYYTVQRKWLVESGSPYSPPMNGRPDSELDEFMGIIDSRAMWQPMKAEWRDLPIVSEEEAGKDSKL